jgi:hypothetical protein
MDPEDIDFIPPPPPPVNSDKFYAHYDNDTKKILSISNEKLPTDLFSIEILYEYYEKVMTGKKRFSDYVIDTDVDGNIIFYEISVESLIKKSQNIFSVVKQSVPTDIEIYWNGNSSQWDIISNKAGLTDTILFFITSNDDPNFLIRSIMFDLKNQKKHVVFEHPLEQHIENLSIFSNSPLTQSLRIQEEINE